MFQQIFVLLLLVLSVISCQHQREVHFSKIIPLKTIQTEIPLSNRTNFTTIDNKLFIVALENNKRLIKYNFETQVAEKELDISIYPNQQVYTFQWVNDDSIFIHFIPSDHPKKYHDSSFFLFSTTKTAQIINIHHTPLRSSVCYEDSCYYAKKYNEIYVGGLLYLNLFTLNTCPGQPLYYQRKPILGGHLDLQSGEFIRHQFWLPQVPLGVQYAMKYDEHFQSVFQGKILYSFANNSKIIEYNPKDHKLKEINTILSMADTITALTKFYTNCLDKPYGESNQSIYYGLNSQKNCIIRTVALKPITQTPHELNNPSRVFAVLDKNYQKIHEFVSSEYFLVRPFGNSWLLRKMDSSSGFLEFIVAKLEPYQTTVSAERKKLQTYYAEKTKQPTGWIAYNQKHQLENQKHILYIPSSTCPSCMRYMLKYLHEHQKDWKGKGLDVILMCPEYFLKDLKQELPDIDFSLFKQDLTEDYKNFVPSFINANLIDFENGKIIKETIINPSDLYLINDVVKSLETNK